MVFTAPIQYVIKKKKKKKQKKKKGRVYQNGVGPNLA
jgi:hypothetical protein